MKNKHLNSTENKITVIRQDLALLLKIKDPMLVN